MPLNYSDAVTELGRFRYGDNSARGLLAEADVSGTVTDNGVIVQRAGRDKYTIETEA